MADQVYLNALAGLLHDIGKFAQRAGVTVEHKVFTKDDYGEHGYHAWLGYEKMMHFIPVNFQNALSSVLFHHRNDLEEPDLLRLIIADHLAAGERRTGSEEQADPKEARLLPILSNVELFFPSPKGVKHRLAPLSIDNNDAYPTDEKEGDYADLWNQMIRDLTNWKEAMDKQWDDQPIDAYFTTLMAVFHKYLWCIPSATPWQKGEAQVTYRSWPDVSLYDHCRLTSAIAACLTYDQSHPNEQSDEPVALLVRGDVSGIQGFIYRLSRPEAETEHIAKRLRGRSFYLQLITEALAEWILRELGLPDSSAIFIGGGRFDLLLPIKSEEKLANIKAQLSSWLLDEFHGELNILISEEKITPEDFKDARNIYNRLDENLEQMKQRKWERELQQDFFIPHGEVWHVCNVCNLTPMPDSNQTCSLCILHARIGKYLPHTKFLAFFYDDVSGLDNERLISFEGFPFNIKTYLILNKDEVKLFKESRKVKIYSINNTDEFIFPGLASSFKFLANAAPIALNPFDVKNEPTVNKNDVLHFEAIAELSKGARRLGILKVDVDRLGLIMSEGLNEEDEVKPIEQRLRPTLSRTASLSRMLDLFFSGYLNRICTQVSEEWKKNSNSRYTNAIDQLFYILYSGGDDAFVVGPWDQVLKLALAINKEFHLYTGNNPNLSLSAGFIQVKPRYPTQKFAELVNDVEKLAKNKGRNRIAAFGETMIWRNSEDYKSNDEPSFEWLFDLAIVWSDAIIKNELPKGIVYDLGALYRQHLTKNGKLRPMWTPRLYYMVSRRIKPEIRDNYLKDLIRIITSRNVLVPVSIVSLLTRERS